MPSVRAFFRAVRAGLVPARIGRLAGAALLVGIGAFALLLLAVRFLVLPQLESQRDAIAAALSRELGHPVEIAVLATGWDGWNPKLVIEGLRILDRERAASTPLLELPAAELVVAWTSLPLFEVRLKELVIERPRFAVRRDRAGMLHVAGIEFDPAQAADDFAVAAWLLRQRQIVVRDALITWNDDLRNAPQLVLDRVQFRLHNQFGRHRFGLTGAPPDGIAAPIDIRGDIRGIAGNDWRHARGKLYVELDYADVAAWREWLPLPVPIASGKGAVRLWLDFAAGRVREAVADLALAEVSARLDERLEPLELAHLAGRVGWRVEAGRNEVFTRDLVLESSGAQRLGPTNLDLLLEDATGARSASGALEVDRLDLAPLSTVAAYVPFTAAIRADLARFAPRGTLSHLALRWEGTPEAPGAFRASAEFADLGLRAGEAGAMATGLSGRIDATQDKGELRIASGGVELAAPRAFEGSIPVDRLEGVLDWERKAGEATVRIQRLEFENADLAGSVAGTYRWAAADVGKVELNVVLPRVEAARLHRYLPIGAEEGLRDWMRSAFKGGTVADVRMKLAGSLAELPFATGVKGQFLIRAKAKNLAFDYAARWPGMTDVEADVRVDGARLTIDAARGRIFGAALGRTRAEIADLTAENPLLRVEGSAAGPLGDFLRFVEESPVAGRIGHATDGAEALGEARLALRLELPLGQPDDAKVAGELAFANAQLRLPQVPALGQLNGTLAFTGSEVRARDVGAEVLGGPAKLDLATAEGSVRVAGAGSAPLAQVRRALADPNLDRLSGTLDWSLDAEVRNGFANWALESTLTGVAVDLPSPLGKSATESVPLRIERRASPTRPGEDVVFATYGRLAQFAAHRRLEPAGAKIDRALLSVGDAAQRPDARTAERAGFWLRADLPALDVDKWLAFARRGKDGAGRAGEAETRLDGVDLKAGQLDAFGVRLNDVAISARRSSDGWRLDLSGVELAGTANWVEPGADLPNGRVTARLNRLGLPAKSDIDRHAAEASERAAEPKRDGARDTAWPELDVLAETLNSKGRDLGRLELRAQPRGAEWRIEQLVLVNENGRLDASGEWRTTGQQQTQLDIALDAHEPGGFLARFGYPDMVHGAPTRIDGQLAWAGSPRGLDFPTLSGALRIETGPGRFSRIEPGLGKLLGVLSLQALPRRISLDFQDVFSDGFAFDQLTGTMRIANGVMSTSDLKLVGPAAQVSITGEADLASETQRLAVRVQPALAGGVSAGAALLFLANPLVGAAVGAGSLLAQKVLKDPIEQMFSYQYTVTGSWSDPAVTRSGSATASVAPGTPGTEFDRGSP